MELIQEKNDQFIQPEKSLQNPSLQPQANQTPKPIIQNLVPFDLMKLAGCFHRYQSLSLLIWCILWLVTGCILLGTPFLVYVTQYDCSNVKDFDSNKLNCHDYVCNQPLSMRQKYLPSEQIVNIATTLLQGDVRCQQSWILDLLESLVYLGSFTGYLTLSIVTDNIGRKKSMLICYGIGSIGILIAAVSSNIYLTGIGLFLSGLGTDIAINICFYFITQTVSDKGRMKHSVAIQLFFSLGCLLNVGLYYIFRNWRIIFLLFLVIPSFICLFLIYRYIEQTPYFLIIKHKPEVIEQSILRIAKMNKIQIDLNYLRSKIEQLKDKYSQKQEIVQTNRSGQIEIDSKQQVLDSKKMHQHTYTPIDLFKHRSIRFISISICIISFFIYVSYYGPLLLLSKFGFNIYINGIVVSMSQVIIYPICYFTIHKLKRRITNFSLSISSFLVSVMLIFVFKFSCQKQHNQCTFFRVLQLFLIFIYRFCASIEFALFLIYCNQILPTQIRGIGIGVSSAIGTIASSSAPYLLGSSINSNQKMGDAMIIFAIISIISAFLFIKMPETLGKHIPDEIQQMRVQKEKINFGRQANRQLKSSNQVNNIVQ